MKYKILCALILLGAAANLAAGQRTRTVGEAPAEPKQAETKPASQPVATAPASVKAKYEGGIFGYRNKVDGTLTFDDTNQRLVFRNEQGKELIQLPYKAVLSVYADTQSKRPTAARVIGGASIYTLPALLIKKKYRYLTMQYRDPDTRAEGTTSFKIDNKETLGAMVATLASKAELTPRGDIYVRQAGGQ